MKIHINPRFQLAPGVVAALQAISDRPLNPCPRQATYLRTFIRLPGEGVIGLVQAEWPPGLRGTGFNLVHVAPTVIAKTLISVHNILQRDESIRAHMPNLRCYADAGDMTALVFIWPESHPDADQIFHSELLSEALQLGKVNLPKLQDCLDAILMMLTRWAHHTQPKTTACSAASILDQLRPFENPPVPPRAAMLTFDLDDIPSLPNPLSLVNDPTPLKRVTVHTQLGNVHGALTADRILSASTPLIVDWSMSRKNTPIWLDYARLELDLLLRLVSPVDADIWAYEWPSLTKALRKLPLEPDNATGRLVPSALKVVAPIREVVNEQAPGNSLSAFWLSAVRAGLDVVSDPMQTGANRLAATLYSAVALDVAQENLKFNWPDTSPSAVPWPGFLAWRSLPARLNSSSCALLVGAGVFVNDGKIDQLPQVQNDLEELAAFLDQHNYQVHILRDSNFTRTQLQLKFDALRQDLQFTNRSFIACFCGHGVLRNGRYYLVTGDATVETIEERAVALDMWLDGVTQLNTSRKLILMNSCYSGQTFSTPFKISYKEGGTFVLLVSASAGEESYMLRDDPYSLFIGTVLEALGAANRKSKPTRLFDLLDYVTRKVPIRANKIGKSQHPTFVLNQITENFMLI